MKFGLISLNVIGDIITYKSDTDASFQINKSQSFNSKGKIVSSYFSPHLNNQIDIQKE